MLISYLKNLGSRRIIGMIAGNIIIGIGCGLFKLSMTGNDPFSACGMALAALLGVPYGVFNIFYNIFFFLFQIIWGRRYIGISTIVNWFGLGFVTQGTYDLLSAVWMPGSIPAQLIVVAAGVLVASFGIAFYQTSDTGLSPYDSLSIMMTGYWHIPYFWCRMATDLLSAVVTWCAGGLLGIGTVISAFGFGPFVHFFTIHVAEPWMNVRKETSKKNE